MRRSFRWSCALVALIVPAACAIDSANAPSRTVTHARLESETDESEQVVFQVQGVRDVAQTFSSGLRNDTLTRVLVTLFADPDSTILSYDVNKCPFPFLSCFSVERGFGLIPSADVEVMGNGSMRLHTNTSGGTNPDFQRTAGGGGEIEVNWAPELGGDFQEVNGTSTLMRGPEFTRTAGHFFTTTAVAGGQVMGTDVHQGSRQAFTARRAGMTIQVIRSP